jgi:F0F1-type ATP synthase membrane subunit b/b'
MTFDRYFNRSAQDGNTLKQLKDDGLVIREKRQEITEDWHKVQRGNDEAQTIFEKQAQPTVEALQGQTNIIQGLKDEVLQTVQVARRAG